MPPHYLTLPPFLCCTALIFRCRPIRLLLFHAVLFLPLFLAHLLFPIALLPHLTPPRLCLLNELKRFLADIQRFRTFI